MDGRTVQSVLAPAGDPASHIAWLWWVMWSVSTVVWLAVVLMVAAALIRSARKGREGVRPRDRSVWTVVGAAVVVTLLTLVALLLASVGTSRRLQALHSNDNLLVRVTGYQWWWDVEYDDIVPARRVRTANEIHLPAGRSVRLLLDSADVIHSFWAPNLAGKMDLIPGRRNELTLRPVRPGTFRAQCAEYCGLQHAHMSLRIVVEPAADFSAWLDAQRGAARTPTSATALRGLQLFESGTCAMCHRIAGTNASARTAPDLTHLASRPSIGAETLPNDPASLAAWIENPHRFKPGNKMPPSALPPVDREAIVAYLGELR